MRVVLPPGSRWKEKAKSGRKRTTPSFGFATQKLNLNLRSYGASTSAYTSGGARTELTRQRAMGRRVKNTTRVAASTGEPYDAGSRELFVREERPDGV